MLNMSSDNADARSNAEFLKEMAGYRMPFGRYQGRLLVDLPEPYIVWYHRKGFPAGKLGHMLEILYEIKVNGLEYLLRKLNNDDQEE
jgi:uncharacterized protein